MRELGLGVSSEALARTRRRSIAIRIRVLSLMISDRFVRWAETRRSSDRSPALAVSGMLPGSPQALGWWGTIVIGSRQRGRLCRSEEIWMRLEVRLESGARELRSLQGWLRSDPDSSASPRPTPTTTSR